MPTRFDTGVAAVLLVVSQIEVWAFGVAGGGAVAAACLATIALVSAWRTRFPLSSTAGIWIAAFACATWSAPPASVTFAAADLLAFYRIGRLRDRRRAYLALIAGLLLGVPITENISLNKYLAIVLTSFVVPWLVGTLHLRHQRTRELEREREQAVEQERARLARELHDLVSHNVGMIVVQAGAGDVLLDREPERAREALHAIEAGARDALLELRRLLGLLRDGDRAELGPQRTLAGLEELADRVRSAGLDVSLCVEDHSEALDPAVDLSAYRIVQEALTNVLKHARATRARVVVRQLGDTLEVEVSDNGHGRTASSKGGHGLNGIAERVALLGGKLETGTGADGGFRVHALLPIAPTP